MSDTLNPGLLVKLAPLAGSKRTHGDVVSVRRGAADVEDLAAGAWFVQVHEGIRLLDAVWVRADDVAAWRLEAWEERADLGVVIPGTVAEFIGSVPRRIDLIPLRFLWWSLALSFTFALAFALSRFRT